MVEEPTNWLWSVRENEKHIHKNYSSEAWISWRINRKHSNDAINENNSQFQQELVGPKHQNQRAISKKA